MVIMYLVPAEYRHHEDMINDQNYTGTKQQTLLVTVINILRSISFQVSLNQKPYLRSLLIFVINTR